MTQAMRVQQFAKETGVTVRTLHHYDRLGLLKPQRTESGYRVYGEREVIRLQRITVLKFIGCSLQEINDLIDRKPDDLRTTLDMQQEALELRRKSLDGALKAVEQARRVLDASGAADWKTLKRIVETIEMEQNTDWMNKYYSPEAQKEIERRRHELSAESIEEGQKRWGVLFADCELAVKQGLEPSSRRGVQLALRWFESVNAFTGGNQQIKDGLNKFYADQPHWPASFKRPWSDEVDEFMKKAKAAADLRCE